ncbi:uncharacterized protein zgc:174863 [Puntigrus tetrazona]|uniref:uncharacterized protein zgc:174863 n=1 Tax=Puntigrus tetrazona TaxID=1606681 RepID=UPI001C8A7575|nr:uncharacterized protein zgc:174863 [Puntigrus tetrazona]
MSSMKVVLVVSLFLPAVNPMSDLWNLECHPKPGIFGQTTSIKCVFKDIEHIQIIGVYLRKTDQIKRVFTQTKSDFSGDQRFSLENMAMGPSLQISNTQFSDEGKYMYCVETDSGRKEIEFSISVTAKYKDPVTSTWPEHITNGEAASLYCNATDGYPGGFIQWFDHSGSNWTMNSHLTKTPTDINGVKSVALSSKLTFKSINLDLAPYRCIVFNGKFEQDAENTLDFSAAISNTNEESSRSNTTKIVAGVMVIGSLIAGLLCALLCFRNKKYRYNATYADDPENVTAEVHTEDKQQPFD